MTNRLDLPAPSMTADDLPAPEIVSADEWEAARSELEVEENRLDAARRDLAARRRRMPMTRIDRDYRFLAADGSEVGLVDLFAGRSQLITYKFFYAPDVENWPEGACSGCSMFADGMTHPAHLDARDVALAFVSAAPPERISGYQARMGWDLPWFSEVGDDFSRDFGVEEWFGLNVFLRRADDVYRTYFLQGPAVEAIGSAYTLLELAPFGRQESTEDSPEGWPQGDPFAWYRPHDSYTAS